MSARNLLQKRLGDSWVLLANSLEIEDEVRRTWAKGREGDAIWVWCAERGRIALLPDALRDPTVDRGDLSDAIVKQRDFMSAVERESIPTRSLSETEIGAHSEPPHVEKKPWFMGFVAGGQYYGCLMGAVKAGIPLVILLAGVYVFRDVFFSGPGIRRPRILASPALITRLEDEAAAVAKLQEALDKGENGQIESTYTTYLDNVNRYSDMLTKTNLDEEDRTRFASVQKLTAELNKKRACRETLLGIHEALKSLGYEPDIGIPQKEPNWRAQVDEWVDAHPESRLTMAKHEDLPPRDFVAVRGLFDPSVLPKDQANQVRALAPGSRPTILAVGDPGLEWGTDAAWDISRVIEAIEGKNSPFPDEAPPALFANGAVRLLNEMDLARLRSLTPKAPDNPPQAMPPESIERVLATFHTKVDRAGGVFRIELWATEPERKLIVESELPAEEWPKGSTRSVDNHVSQALPSGPVEATIRLITPSNARDIHWITDIRLEATTSKGRRLVWDHENARLGTVTGRRSLQLGPAMPQPQ